MLGFIKDIIRVLRVVCLRTIYIFISKDYCLSVGRVMILAPHPDDEVFGCSGLIQKLIFEGKEVYIIFMTKGESSHNGCCNIDKTVLQNERTYLTYKALNILGVNKENIFRLSYPDGYVNYNSKETLKLKNLINNIKPDAIFVPHNGEGWNDHLETANIARKLISGTDIKLYSYCVWFWYYNVWKIDWKNAFLLTMTDSQHKLKNMAIDTYIYAKAQCGKPYSGVLPKVFVCANRWKKELYFKS